MTESEGAAPRVVLSLHMPGRTHALVKRAAKKAGVNVSKYIRDAAEDLARVDLKKPKAA